MGANDQQHDNAKTERGVKKTSVYEIPVDRDWAWVILIAVGLKEIILSGLTQFTFGVVYLEFQTYYSSRPATTASVGSLTYAASFLISPLTGYLSVRWSTRTLMFGAAILSTVAVVASMFLPSIYYLYLTWGLMLGLADGMTFAPTLGLLRRYFDRHLALAIGLSYSGNGVGQLAGSFLFPYLVAEYGLKGTMLIWAGILLNLFVCALLMRPTAFYTKCTKTKSSAAIDRNAGHMKNSPTETKPAEDCSVPGIKIMQDAENSTVHSLADMSKIQVTSCCHISLIKNATFFIFNTAIFVIFIASYPIRVLLFPGHCHQVGLSCTQVSLLPTTVGVAVILGRPLLGYLADRMYISVSAFFSLCCVMCGALILVVPHVGHEMAPLVVMAALVGFPIATLLTIPPVILREVVADDEYTVASGWMALFMGIPSLFTSALFGYIFEETGSWEASFYICGCSLILGGVVTFLNHRRSTNGKVSTETINTKL